MFLKKEGPETLGRFRGCIRGHTRSRRRDYFGIILRESHLPQGETYLSTLNPQSVIPICLFIHAHIPLFITLYNPLYPLERSKGISISSGST